MVLLIYCEQINTNGSIQLSTGFVNAYLTDADTSTTGNVYYRTLITSEQMFDVQRIISRTFYPLYFQVTQVFVATYDQVPEAGGDSSIVSHPICLLKQFLTLSKI